MELVRSSDRIAAEKPPMGELGGSGTAVSSSGGKILLTQEDYNPDLRGPAFYNQIDRMRLSDSQVKAVMSIVKLPLLAADWGIEPASDKPEDIEIAEWIEDRLFNRQMRTWDYILRHILLSLDYGTMPFEEVWHVVDDDIMSRPMVHLKKLGPRMPRTISEWYVTDEGELESVVQTVEKDGIMRDVTIPGEKILPFVHDMEGANYRGTSILRQARKDWTIKERLQRINQVAIEKRAAGIDVGEMDSSALQDRGNKAAFESVLQSVRTHERAYVLLPEGHRYRIEGISGSVLDPLPSIQYADVMILRGILADFLTAGSSNEGSYALVRDRSSFFLMALEAIANEIVGPFNRFLIPKWVRWNWSNVTEFPFLSHSRLDRRDVKLMADALAQLVPQGIITPDTDIEKEVRELLDMPELKDDPMDPVPPGTPGEPGLDDLVDEDKGPEAFRRLKNRRRTPYRVRPSKPVRARTLAERSVDWMLLERSLDSTEDKIVQAYRAIQERQIEKVVDEAMKAVERQDPEMLERVNIPYKKEAADMIVKPLIDLYRLGQQEVRQEMKRMGGEPMRLATPLDAEEDQSILAFLRARARLIAFVLAERIRGSMLRHGMDMIRDGLTDRLVLQGALTKLSDRAIKGEAALSVSEALNLGRDSTAKRNELFVQKAEY